MSRPADRLDRSLSEPVETFLASAGGRSWADESRRPMLGAELERVRDDVLERDADFPPDDVPRGEGDVGALLAEYARRRRVGED